MSAGKYITRICIIHGNNKNTICVYDKIWPGDEELWVSKELNDEEKEVEDEYFQFPVSGTKRERRDRQELVSLLVTFYQLSRSIDGGGVFKTAFQLPAENRQSNFTVKFTPQFGTLARPKKNINTKISNLVFGQAQTEMVMAAKHYPLDKLAASKSNLQRRGGLTNPEDEEEVKTESADAGKGMFTCAVFYGVNCKPEVAKTLALKLIDQFFKRFDAEIVRFLTMKDDVEDEEVSDHEDMDDELALVDYDSTGTVKGDESQKSNQEYIMSLFKSFDEIAVRFVTQYVDRRDRKISHHRQYQHHGSHRNKKSADDLKMADDARRVDY